jgi:TonB family protein
MEMKFVKILVAAAGLMSCAVLGAFAGEVKVIANPNIKAETISAAELRSLFLEEKITLDGTHIEPVLEKNGAAHERFVHEYLGKSEEDLQMYYRSRVFSGQAWMPKELGSDAEVVDYVARTKGAIGYVSAEASTEGVKILAVIEEGDNGPRKLIRRIEPEYPDTLKRLGIGGVVRLQVTISGKGSVEEVEVLGGNPILAEAAVTAVKQWVYTSGRSRMVTEVRLRFGER